MANRAPELAWPVVSSGKQRPSEGQRRYHPDQGKHQTHAVLLTKCPEAQDDDGSQGSDGNGDALIQGWLNGSTGERKMPLERPSQLSVAAPTRLVSRHPPTNLNTASVGPFLVAAVTAAGSPGNPPGGFGLRDIRPAVDKGHGGDVGRPKFAARGEYSAEPTTTVIARPFGRRQGKLQRRQHGRLQLRRQKSQPDMPTTTRVTHYYGRQPEATPVVTREKIPEATPAAAREATRDATPAATEVSVGDKCGHLF